MERKENMPLWVFLAFSGIETRRAALLLFWTSLAFTIYCIPWGQFLSLDGWAGKLFLIDDWSWFPMMLPVVFWYWAGLRWVDRNGGWSEAHGE